MPHSVETLLMLALVVAALISANVLVHQLEMWQIRREHKSKVAEILARQHPKEGCPFRNQGFNGDPFGDDCRCGGELVRDANGHLMRSYD